MGINENINSKFRRALKTSNLLIVILALTSNIFLIGLLVYQSLKKRPVYVWQEGLMTLVKPGEVTDKEKLESLAKNFIYNAFSHNALNLYEKFKLIQNYCNKDVFQYWKDNFFKVGQQNLGDIYRVYDNENKIVTTDIKRIFYNEKERGYYIDGMSLLMTYERKIKGNKDSYMKIPFEMFVKSIEPSGSNLYGFEIVNIVFDLEKLENEGEFNQK